MTAPHPLFQGTTKVLHFPSSAFLSCLKGFSEKRGAMEKRSERQKNPLFLSFNFSYKQKLLFLVQARGIFSSN